MPLKNREIISILKDLIEVCKDGEQGYKDAADDVKDSEVQKVLLKYSEQRGAYFSELQYVVKKLGGELEFSGTILGILHRRWMDVKFAVAGSNTESILNECLRGEKSAINNYEKAIAREFPPEIMNLVKRQYDGITEACEDIMHLSAELGLNVKTHI